MNSGETLVRKNLRDSHENQGLDFQTDPYSPGQLQNNLNRPGRESGHLLTQYILPKMLSLFFVLILIKKRF